MLPAIFMLSIIAIVFSQLNNCLPKRFSRQTPSYGQLSPRETLSLANSQCPHLPSSGTGWAAERLDALCDTLGLLGGLGELFCELVLLRCRRHAEPFLGLSSDGEERAARARRSGGGVHLGVVAWLVWKPALLAQPFPPRSLSSGLSPVRPFSSSGSTTRSLSGVSRWAPTSLRRAVLPAELPCD